MFQVYACHNYMGGKTLLNQKIKQQKLHITHKFITNQNFNN